jgi:hypothetical protein
MVLPFGPHIMIKTPESWQENNALFRLAQPPSQREWSVTRRGFPPPMTETNR